MNGRYSRPIRKVNLMHLIACSKAISEFGKLKNIKHSFKDMLEISLSQQIYIYIYEDYDQPV
jgi:hypothetical protein